MDWKAHLTSLPMMAGLALLLPQPALADDLPKFEFRGLEAQRAYTFKEVQRFGGRCFDNERGGFQCTDGSDIIAGAPAVRIYSFFSGRLSSMSMSFPNGHVVNVLESLGTKYGPPCRNEKTAWRSKAGVEYPNAVVTWCFATGEMQLSAMGVQRDYADLVFVDSAVGAEIRKANPPKVDF